MQTRPLLAVLLLCAGQAAFAQWLNFPTPGIPRTIDGKPDLKAPAPRVGGKPDLSGIWRKGGDRYIQNIAVDLAPTDVAAWADALYQKRKLDFGKDSMPVLCLPFGPAYTVSRFQQTRFIQTPTMLAMLNDDQTHRVVFMDGRTLEADPNPTWMGYSVGHWDGDTLVVESNGYHDRSWLDFEGHPHTEELRITERYLRRDFGHMDLEVTFTDPKAYFKPIVAKIEMKYQPDTEMLESVCEGEKDRSHMTGAPQQEVKLAVDVLTRYVGIYDLLDDHKRKHTAEMSVASGVLWVDYDSEGKQHLVPFSPTLFSLAGMWWEFTPGGNGEMGLLMRYVEGDERGARRK